MPFRSEPEDAAVGDVFGTLAVVVAVMLTWLTAMPNSSATTCATLMIEPLPHLGAAVIEMHRAVGIDMNKRAGLVEMREREGDSEFDRRQR